MKTTIIALIMFTSIASYGQKRVRFSVIPTASLTMATKTLKEAARKSGFGDTNSGWFGGPTKYPDVERLGLGLLAGVEITTTKKLSYSITCGLPDWGEVQGYGNGNVDSYLVDGWLSVTPSTGFVSFNYLTWIVNPAVNYHYSTNKASIGPAIAFFHYNIENGAPGKVTKLSPGLSISNTFFSKNGKARKVKKGLFLQANLFPNIKSKETIVHLNDIDTLTFPAASINISNLQAGVALEF